MTGRFLRLGRYALRTGADAILFTCSAFGPCIDAVQMNGAAIGAGGGFNRVLLDSGVGKAIADLATSLQISSIVLAFVVRRLPYTLRSSAAILYQISPSVEEASISLGCSPMKTFFKVTAIMMLPGVMAGAILSWITVINELSASVILYTGGTRTMSVSIYTEVIRASYGTAAALSSILTLTTIVSLMIFFKLTGSKDLAL